jgi:hypothetical protein
MDEHARHRDSSSDIGGDSGTPRWVKVFAVVAAIIILLFVFLMLTRGPGGRHGPARHFGSAGTGPLHPTPAVVAMSSDGSHSTVMSGHRNTRQS